MVNENLHLDDAIFLRGWIQCVLDITLADHTKVTNDVDCRGPEHVVVGIGEGLRRSHDDGITRMDSQRVKILQKLG